MVRVLFDLISLGANKGFEARGAGKGSFNRVGGRCAELCRKRLMTRNAVEGVVWGATSFLSRLGEVRKIPKKREPFPLE